MEKMAADTFFDKMMDGVCIFSLKGALEYMNRAAADILGLSGPETFIGKKIRELVTFSDANDGFIQVFLDSITQKSASEELLSFQKPDGSLRQVRVSVSLQDKSPISGQPARIMLLTDYTQFMRVHHVLEKFTSRDIARALLEDPEGDRPGGVLVDATVMISDLRGYTAFSTGIGAADLVKVMNHYFTVMNRIITKYGGTVLEFLGDGIFTSFGVPVPSQNHARAAAMCALEMQRAMEEVNAWNVSLNLPAFSMGIGINTGWVVAGNVGSEDTMKYQCMGYEVNVAGRLVSMSEGGQVLVSGQTLERIGCGTETGERRMVMFKGLTKEMEVCDLRAVHI